MLNFINPIHNELAEQGGKNYKYDGVNKVWNLIAPVVADGTGSVNTTISKVWTGTNAEYQLLAHSDDVVYFVKD